MKFNTLVDYLLEVNLFNKDSLINDINKTLTTKNVSKPEIKNWFLKQYAGWFTSSKDDEVKNRLGRLITHQYKEGEPEWAKKSDILDFMGLSGGEKQRIHHIVDYFNTLDDIDLKKIYKEPYEIIVKKVAEWDEQLKNQKVSDTNLVEGKDIKTELSFKDGYKIVRLLSKKAYELEGNQMGHCVGSYWDETEGLDKNVVIYSLRDPKGLPHVTIEADGPYDFLQIKGKENAAPIPKYIPYIRAFIESGDYTVIQDGDNIGMIGWDGRYYFKDSKEWERIYYDEIQPQQVKKINDYLNEAKDNNGVLQKIDLSGLHLTHLPDFSKFTVEGNFDCNNNQLTSLEGVPEVVGRGFGCSNNKLTSLKGAPKVVKGQFVCSHNQLTSLEGAPEVVEGGFSCGNNQLTSLEGAPKVVEGYFDCNHNQLTSLEGGPKVLEGGFYCSLNKLTSLKGAPKVVKGLFVCSHNQLTSLEGAPEVVKGIFDCANNKLISLEGAPKDVYERDFYCRNNPVKFTLEDIKKAIQRSSETFKEFFYKNGTLI